VFASGTWLVVLASGHVGGGFIAAAGMCLAMILFGFAETMWSPTYLPLVNELAPDDLRGRYNALSAMVQGGGLVIAPLLAGYLLQLGWGDALMLVLAAGAATAALFLGGLERRLSPETNTSANRRTWGRRPWPPLGPHP
jgi:MFS family permease